jgi:hypothetical protein
MSSHQVSGIRFVLLSFVALAATQMLLAVPILLNNPLSPFALLLLAVSTFVLDLILVAAIVYGFGYVVTVPRPGSR